jgi:hypothetical protein
VFAPGTHRGVHDEHVVDYDPFRIAETAEWIKAGDLVARVGREERKRQRHSVEHELLAIHALDSERVVRL